MTLRTLSTNQEIPVRKISLAGGGEGGVTPYSQLCGDALPKGVPLLLSRFVAVYERVGKVVVLVF